MPSAAFPLSTPESLPLNLVRSLRPGQWTKNLFVFGALVFAQRLGDRTSVLRATVAFLVFCVLSGVVYLVNDVLDREQDRHHPLKAQRPIASGALTVSTAIAAALGLGLGALVVAFLLGLPFFATAAAYLALMAAYSVFLKHIVIIDVLTIAAGFGLRAAAGGAAIDVPVSHWLLLCTTLLALFLALSKRRHELVQLADAATGHRPILEAYSPYLLDQMISVVTASTLIAYAFYTISPETTAKFGTSLLSLTIPFPLYGIFRYLYLVHRKDLGGSPAELLLDDRPLLVCIALWAVAVILIIYHPFGAGPGGTL
ncbi:MAG TPA: decaprenyl-phosphate phosphoribosyltransferase [Vicinamibacterales bacterium]|jgi:4-hydroxybenzoate polyprenyltransferase|nr:decaprenyl-phosphate phosphoribosyltransferase [Vicinamibacterales bacterium]